MRISDILRKTILSAGIVFIAVISFQLFFMNLSDSVKVVLGYLTFLSLGIVIIVVVRLKRPKTIFICAAIVVITAAGIIMFKYSRPVLIGDSDLKLYYSTAVKLVENNFDYQSMYSASFPGTITFPVFLALLMKLFGVSRSIPVLLNLSMLCLVSCSSFLYLRAKMAEEWAAAGALLISLNPMLIIYAATCNAEIPFCSMILLSFFAYAKSAGARNNRDKYLWFAVSAFLCGASSVFRPLTIVFVIALIMWIVIFQPLTLKERLLYSLVVCCVFALFGIINAAVVKGVTTYDAPRSSYGWNLYVGASGTGQWNAADSEEFKEVLDRAASPSEVHSYFVGKAWTRYGDMGFGIIPHALKKLTLWFPYEYVAAEAFLYEGSEHGNKNETINVYKTLVMTYDLPLFALALCGCFWSMIAGFKKKRPDFECNLVLVFYLAGSFFILMLTEIAPRYTISYRMVFCILAVSFVYRIVHNIDGNSGRPTISLPE